MDREGSALKDIADKYLCMKVNSGTKMKNVLRHALENFPRRYNIIIWTGAGQAIGKVISCVELFKKEIPGLHQITKLRYIDSDDKAGDVEKIIQIPEINIFLATEAMDASKLEYQWASDVRMSHNQTGNDSLQAIELRQGMEIDGGIQAAESTILKNEMRRKRSRKYQADFQKAKKKHF